MPLVVDIGSTPVFFTRATIRYVTASYHRMGYLRVSHSAGIHRVDFGDTKETRIIFSSCWIGIKTPNPLDAHIV